MLLNKCVFKSKLHLFDLSWTVVDLLLTQAGISTRGLLSAWRFIRSTTMVTKTVRTHTPIKNRKYITTNICHSWHVLIQCIY